jgi:hypothetical protein
LFQTADQDLNRWLPSFPWDTSKSSSYPRLGWVRLDAIDQLLVNVRAGMKQEQEQGVLS